MQTCHPVNFSISHMRLWKFIELVMKNKTSMLEVSPLQVIVELETRVTVYIRGLSCLAIVDKMLHSSLKSPKK